MKAGDEGLKCEDKYHTIPDSHSVQWATIIPGEYQYEKTINIPKVCSVCQLNDFQLAFGTKDGEIDIVNIEENKYFVVKAHEEWVRVLIQLSDGRLVSGAADKLMKVWNLSTQMCELTLEGHEGSIFSLCEMANGYLISGSFDKSVKVWNLYSGNCEKTLLGHNGCVLSIARLLDSDSMIASASHPDYIIRIWNIETEDCVLVIGGGGPKIICLSDGRLASNSKDNTIKIWNLLSGNCEQIIDHGEHVFCLLQLSDHRLVSGSKTLIRIWKADTVSNRVDCLQTLSHEGEGATQLLIELPDNHILSLINNFVRIWK